MAEWDLQAIISRPNKDNDDDDYCWFGSIDIKKEYDQALLFCYPHLLDHHHHHHHHLATIESTLHDVTDGDLNQLYKPFYPLPPPPPPQNNHHHFHDSDHKIQRDQEQEIKNFSGPASNTSQLAPKLKKRKNQQKRVVTQVTSAGLSSDPWAWRKYGQKPIKGSIYPRSYYRCSSSKGCMARRQVEQSCTDSSIYILTYTGDHNHPQPTRRNSLAGITRNRFKSIPKSPINTSDVAVTKSPFHSPTTCMSASSMEDEVLQQQSNMIKEETTFYNNQGHSTMIPPGISDEDYMVFSEDFFEGLEDLESSSNYYSSTKQFPHVFC